MRDNKLHVQNILDTNDLGIGINEYLNYFDVKTWELYTGIEEWDIETDKYGNTGYVPIHNKNCNEVRIALNICTYHRREQIEKNIQKLMAMRFFNEEYQDYYGKLHVFITDNGSELEKIDNSFFHLQYNTNSGGSGGFQKGIEYIKSMTIPFTHVIFMDDDVDFIPETFYRLFALLSYMKREYQNRCVAGRMFCLDRPTVQYSAAEIWNKGDLQHVGFMQDMKDEEFNKVLNSSNGSALNNTDLSEYNGWWFCCYPFEFVRNNDVIPFFLHCDDVEYGLRFLKNGGGRPIILNGIQVWHETAVYRQKPIIQYYDTRNPLFVNEVYGLTSDHKKTIEDWKNKITRFHVDKDYASEYYTILGMLDYLKGIDYLYKINPEKKHRKLQREYISRYKNSILWRIVTLKFRFKYNK